MNGVQGKDKLEPIPAWQRPAPVRSRSKRRRVLWGLVILALIGTVAWVIFRPQVAPAVRMGRHGPGGAAPVPVMAAAAEKGDIAISLNALGTVTPLANVTVKTQIAGQLTEVAFQEGQRVKAGDFLAQVDPRPYQLSLTQYQGQLQRDQALLKDAEVNLARYRTLIAQDSIARQTLDTQDALVEQYRGTVETDKALVDTAKLNLIYCHITAPVGGRVGLRQVDPGNYVQNSDSNGLVVITQLQPITVLFTVPEDNLPAVMKRLKEGGVLPVAASDRTQTAKLASGRLVTVDNQIDTTTGTIKMRAQFDNADEALFPNQFVNVQLLVDTLKDATVVPPAAIQRGVVGTFVYVVKDDNTVTVRPVKIGPSTAQQVAIGSGLAIGEKVVIDGADKLREGASVTLPAAKESAAPTAPGGADPGSAAPAAPRPAGAKDGEHDHPRTPDGEHRHRKDQ